MVKAGGFFGLLGGVVGATTKRAARLRIHRIVAIFGGLSMVFFGPVLAIIAALLN